MARWWTDCRSAGTPARGSVVEETRIVEAVQHPLLQLRQLSDGRTWFILVEKGHGVVCVPNRAEVWVVTDPVVVVEVLPALIVLVISIIIWSDGRSAEETGNTSGHEVTHHHLGNGPSLLHIVGGGTCADQ